MAFPSYGLAKRWDRRSTAGHRASARSRILGPGIPRSRATTEWRPGGCCSFGTARKALQVGDPGGVARHVRSNSRSQPQGDALHVHPDRQRPEASLSSLEVRTCADPDAGNAAECQRRIHDVRACDSRREDTDVRCVLSVSSVRRCGRRPRRCCRLDRAGRRRSSPDGSAGAVPVRRCCVRRRRFPPRETR